MLTFGNNRIGCNIFLYPPHIRHLLFFQGLRVLDIEGNPIEPPFPDFGKQEIGSCVCRPMR